MKVPLTAPVPACVTQAALPVSTAFGLGLVMVHVVSVGRKPVPVTVIVCPVSELTGEVIGTVLRVIVGPTVMLNTACA
jgi:hypothetical protein